MRTHPQRLQAWCRAVVYVVARVAAGRRLASHHPFERMESDANYMKYFEEVDKDGNKKDGPPSENDWENAKNFVKFLETFYEVTMKFSGSTYVTSNRYFIEITGIQEELYTLAFDEDEDSLLVCMAKGMWSKYDDYWGQIEDDSKSNEGLLIALVLDPCYKFAYLGHCFKAFHDANTCVEMVKKVKGTLRRLFDSYNEMFFGVISSNSQVPVQQSQLSISTNMGGRLGGRSSRLHSSFVQQ